MRLETEFIFSSFYVHHNHLTVVTAGSDATIGGGDSNRANLDSTELIARNVRCGLTQSL